MNNITSYTETELDVNVNQISNTALVVLVTDYIH